MAYDPQIVDCGDTAFGYVVLLIFVVLLVLVVLSIIHILLINSQFPSPTFSPVQVYESAGRMFLLSDIKTVRSGLDRKSEAVKEKVRVFLLLMIVMILLMIAIILVLLKVHTLIGNKAELSPAPEFQEISRIREFSENSTENSTEFLCYFQNWSKTLQKASECYQNLGKAPEIAQNFYIFVKST